MARLNTKNTKTRMGNSPVQSTGAATRTHEGGEGFLRDEKSELFLLAVGRFHGEDSFYESADQGTDRFRRLVRSITVNDPAWVAEFLRWLRGPEANIRTGAIVGAVEYARSIRDVNELDRETLEGAPTVRSVISSVLQRADEPAELLSYWMASYGRTIPSAVKRGVGDAVIRLGSEYAYAKYDSKARGLSYADVLNLVHPGDRKSSSQTLKAYQHDLFELATSAPYRDVEPGESLTMLRARQTLMATPVAQRRAVVLDEPERLAEAGVTWEALAGWLQGPMDAKAWEAIIPSMGVFALARNLRNFDEAGIGKKAVATVIGKLSDPVVIERSRMLPFRWLSAYDAVFSDRWRAALADALEHSTRNIPELDGRTLVLVDNSGSMQASMSDKSKISRNKAGALFGASLAARLGQDRVTLVAFGTESQEIPLPRGGSVLQHVDSLLSAGVGWGTNTWLSVRNHLNGHDRIMIFTDEQTHSDRGAGYRSAGAAKTYTWNLAGYQAGHAPSGLGEEGNFQTVGGLSDATFKLIPFMERGREARWPWEV